MADTALRASRLGMDAEPTTRRPENARIVSLETAMQEEMTDRRNEQRLVDLYRELTGATERQAASVYMYQQLRPAAAGPVPSSKQSDKTSNSHS